MEGDQEGDPEIWDIASSIAKRSPLKSFPEEYLQPMGRSYLDIPIGSDIIMFRQDEFIVVSIDSRRVYLRSNIEAKYVFYSAKRGQGRIANPSGIDLETVIGSFEDDLDKTLAMINVECAKLAQRHQNEVKALVSKLLGYHDIF